VLVHGLLLCTRMTQMRRSSFACLGNPVVANCRTEWWFWVSSRFGHGFENDSM
jgi:hypothetical protein